jgi:hypothetical protein
LISSITSTALQSFSVLFSLFIIDLPAFRPRCGRVCITPDRFMHRLLRTLPPAACLPSVPSLQPAPVTSSAGQVAAPPRVEFFFQKETDALGNSVAEQAAIDQGGVRFVRMLTGVSHSMRGQHGDYYLL